MVKPDVEAHTLFGWWKILSFQVEFEDAGERADTYGVNPLGHMVIERDRMMSILTSRERPNNDPTALFETMIAVFRFVSCRGWGQAHHKGRHGLASSLDWHRAGSVLQGR
jgi:Lipocalin-like domain